MTLQHHISKVSVGKGHFLAVTTDHVVFSWGDNCRGQLGQDAPSINAPTPIHSLNGKNIVSVLERVVLIRADLSGILWWKCLSCCKPEWNSSGD
jgi:hypothetical protein